MPNIFLDPFILSCPRPSAHLEEFESFIRNIASWRELRCATWAHVYLQSATMKILVDTGTYPLWPDIQKAINKFEDLEVDTKDIVRLVEEILNNVPSICDSFGIGEFLLEDVSSEPYDHLTNRHELFVEQYFNVAMTSYILEMYKIDMGKNFVFTRGLDGDFVSSRIRANVLDVEISDHIALALPLLVDFSVTLCGSYLGIKLSIDPVCLLERVDWLDNLNDCIELSLFQRLYSCGHASRPWSIGSHFFATIRQLGVSINVSKRKSILKACIDTILGENRAATHSLRTSIGGNSSQRKRGDDKAWRRDIDDEYHLHYWETANGPEFGSVVVHGDLSIPY